MEKTDAKTWYIRIAAVIVTVVATASVVAFFYQNHNVHIKTDISTSSSTNAIESETFTYPYGIQSNYDASLVKAMCKPCYGPVTYSTPIRTSTHRQLKLKQNTMLHTERGCNVTGKTVFVGSFSIHSPHVFTLGAFGPSDKVFAQTDHNGITPANGVDWYHNTLDSMGFAASGTGINQFSYGDRCGEVNFRDGDILACTDTEENDHSNYRISWSLNPTIEFGGFRLGYNTSLYNDDENMKAIYLCT